MKHTILSCIAILMLFCLAGCTNEKGIENTDVNASDSTIVTIEVTTTETSVPATIESIAPTIEPTNIPATNTIASVEKPTVVPTVKPTALQTTPIVTVPAIPAVTKPMIVPTATVEMNVSDKIKAPAEVYSNVVNSTVWITANFDDYSTSCSTGFVLSTDGYIMASYGAVAGAESIVVTMYDGSEYAGKEIGYDTVSNITVLKIDAEKVEPVKTGDLGGVDVGDGIVTIGAYPYERNFAMVTGYISSVQPLLIGCSAYAGSAVFNLQGEVIAVAKNKESTADHMLAIPIYEAVSAAEKIIENVKVNGYFSKPYIGVSVATVSEESQAYGLPQGASVMQIVENSPAATAGLLVNDIITKVNGQEIAGSNDLVTVVQKAKIGDELKLTIYRMGDIIELAITVGEQSSAKE